MRPKEQDASRSWPLLLGELLNAQVHLIAWSGIGVSWNAPMCDIEPMSAVWDQRLANDRTGGIVAAGGGGGSSGGDGGSSSHQAGGVGGEDEWLPDAILIYCGGNDYWTMGEKPLGGKPNLKQRSEGHFVEGFTSWLLALRKARPTCPIYVLSCDEVSGSCLPSTKAQEEFTKVMDPLLKQAVANAGDENMHVIPLGGSPPVSHADDSDWGRIGHWSVQGHAKIAAGIAPLIEL